jgi:N-acetylglucosaminyl-diphospho-decaprenol L-rhamnosyltransferase
MSQRLEVTKIGDRLSLLTAMDLSIIIVNWNSIAYLRECIASIYEHTRDLLFEIIAVDNASPAGDADLLEPQFPGITVIKSAENLGFAGANNLGFKHSTGKYVLFLNPDTKLASSAINSMVQGIQALPDAGIVGCKLLNTDLSIQTSCIQTFPTIVNQLLDSDWLRERWPNSRLWGTKALFSNIGLPARVEVVSGACMLVRREVFEQVGLFTEDYFMYAEDLDLCYKAERAGYSNYYLGTATVIHHGGKSSNPESATRMKWKSITQFCETSRGHLYALMFRIAMASAALGRVVAISGIGLFGNVFGTPQARQAASAKWKLVLRAVLTPSNSSRSLRGQRRAASEQHVATLKS